MATLNQLPSRLIATPDTRNVANTFKYGAMLDKKSFNDFSTIDSLLNTTDKSTSRASRLILEPRAIMCLARAASPRRPSACENCPQKRNQLFVLRSRWPWRPWLARIHRRVARLVLGTSVVKRPHLDLTGQCKCRGVPQRDF